MTPLRASGYELFYWNCDSPAAEVDFVIQKEGKVIPIEVRCDTHVHARSLKHYCRLYAPELAIRVTRQNFGCEEGIISVPLYGAYCI